MIQCAYIYIYICIYTHLRNHHKFSGVLQWIVSGMFQHIFTGQRYFTKDRHFPIDCLRELSHEMSVAFSNGSSCLYFLVCNIFAILPRDSDLKGPGCITSRVASVVHSVTVIWGFDTIFTTINSKQHVIV